MNALPKGSVAFAFCLSIGFIASEFAHAVVLPGMDTDLPTFVQGEVLLKLRPGYALTALDNLNVLVGVTHVEKCAIDRWYLLQIPREANVVASVERYRSLECVEDACPDYFRYAACTFYGFYLHNIIF